MAYARYLDKLELNLVGVSKTKKGNYVAYLCINNKNHRKTFWTLQEAMNHRRKLEEILL